MFLFRMYALRKVKDTFRENSTLTNTTEISAKFEDGVKNLEVIKRQVIHNLQMFTQ